MLTKNRMFVAMILCRVVVVVVFFPISQTAFLVVVVSGFVAFNKSFGTLPNRAPLRFKYFRCVHKHRHR